MLKRDGRHAQGQASVDDSDGSRELTETEGRGHGG
jgi:hypothetical protein